LSHAQQRCAGWSTGVDSGRSKRFSTGVGAGSGVDIFIRTGAGAGVIFSRVCLRFRCIFAVIQTVTQELNRSRSR